MLNVRDYNKINVKIIENVLLNAMQQIYASEGHKCITKCVARFKTLQDLKPEYSTGIQLMPILNDSHYIKSSSII